MMSRRNFFVLTILQVVGLLHRSQCSAFVVRHALLDTTSHHQASWTKGQQKYLSPAAYQPPLARNNQNAVKSYNHVLPRQRRSVASIQTMGLFGLGAAEIAVILIVVVFVLGPNQIGKMTGNFAGRFKGEYDGLPDELKKIPEEFQKGYDESTVNARARNAKKMEKVPEEDKPDE